MSTNDRRCDACPIYGKDLVESVQIYKPHRFPKNMLNSEHLEDLENLKEFFSLYHLDHLAPVTIPDLLWKLTGFMNRFQMFVHPVVAMRHDFVGQNLIEEFQDTRSDIVKKMIMMPLLQTPETRLIQYDCGKLQVLVRGVSFTYRFTSMNLK